MGQAEEQPQQIISEERFIESMRDFGLTTLDAVKELVDNSFDANAENVWITVGKDSEGRHYLIVEDDGKGIPFDKMQEVLSFGGRLPGREGEETTGKYGFGLPSSAFCQSSRTELYSISSDEDRADFAFNTIDVDNLKTNGGELPYTRSKDLPSKYDFHIDSGMDSGTVVIMADLIRPQYNTVDGLARNIKKDLAEFQRVFLRNGKTIEVNGEELEAADPLMMHEGSAAVEECGLSEKYGEIEPIEFPEEGEDDETPQVEVEIRKLPIQTIVKEELEDKYEIGKETQGFYIVRKNRQIAGGLSLHMFTKHSRYNYFRGEIRFPPALDEKFGIQTNKSRFSLDPDLRDEIEDRVKTVLTELGNDILEERDKARSEREKKKAGDESTSEKVANRTLPSLQSSGHTPTEEEKEEQRKEVEKEIEEVKDREDLSEEEKQSRIERLKDRLDRESINRKIEVLGSGQFYEMTHKGNQIDVTINQSHSFYDKIYRKAREEDDPELQTYLELLIFSLAKAEDAKHDQEQVRRFYDQERFMWSMIMRSFLEEADKEFEDE
ncbi:MULTISPECIES: ATP-binding protein [Haloarcula]|uniref:ATP-binding protein n=1 Tax=Haloarcula TaxID=2237 RepID=UPI0023E83CAD|nr:ATP-binding protein [Halomicroarcula sp. SHR3]